MRHIQAIGLAAWILGKLVWLALVELYRYVRRQIATK